MRVRFTSVSWSNILIDKRLTVAWPNDMRQTGQAIEKKHSGLDLILYCYKKYLSIVVLKNNKAEKQILRKPC